MNGLPLFKGNNMGREVLKPCENCGELFLARVRSLKVGRGKFCSISCNLKKRHATGMRGAVSPNWKGGIAKDPERYRETYNKKHPERYKARQLAQYAVKSGKIEKEPCVVCNSQESEIHHEDYSKPLDIFWFCRKHHLDRDSQLRKERNART